MFSESGSEFSNFGILRLITASEKKLFSLTATFPLFVIRVSPCSTSFMLSVDCTRISDLTRIA